MAQTLLLDGASPADIERAGSILRQGGTVAFPTETVYGLGANALDAEAVARIFEAKRRPSWDPLIVHIADSDQLGKITQLTPELKNRVDILGKAFWPGPLTLLLPRTDAIPDAVTAGRPLVGVRVPRHPVALALLQAADVPLAAPSANTFGHTSPTTATHVLADLEGRIDAVLDGGATEVGLESTVLDPGQTPMVLYRPGAVTASAITATTGIPVEAFQPAPEQTKEPREALPSPGVGIRHYAPRATVVLAEGSEAGVQIAVQQGRREAGSIVAALLPFGWKLQEGVLVEHWGSWSDPAELAARLFAGLRSLDDLGATTIVCPMPEPGGLRDAIRDRLAKAARTQ